MENISAAFLKLRSSGVRQMQKSEEAVSGWKMNGDPRAGPGGGAKHLATGEARRRRQEVSVLSLPLGRRLSEGTQ